MSCRTRVRAGGFTLLEVVVAIALFALLMSIVYSGFSTAVRAYDAAEQRVGDVERMRVVSAFIRRSAGGAHALAIAVRREWALQFEGASNRLHYVADLPGYVGVGGLHDLVLELEPNGDHHDLVMRRRPILFDRFGEMQGEYESRVLAEKISGFVLRFYGSLDENDEIAWRDDWVSANNMPLLVEFAVTPENGPAWPLLQVHPQVDTVQYMNATNVASEEPPTAPDSNSDTESDDTESVETQSSDTDSDEDSGNNAAQDPPNGQAAAQ